MATTNFSPIRSVKVLSFSRASTDSESDCGSLWSFESRLNGFVSVYHMIQVVIRVQELFDEHGILCIHIKTSCQSKEKTQPHKHMEGVMSTSITSLFKRNIIYRATEYYVQWPTILLKQSAFHV